MQIVPGTDLPLMGVCFTTLYLVVYQCVNAKTVPGTYLVRVPGTRTYYVPGKFCSDGVTLQPETTRMKDRSIDSAVITF